VGNGHEAISIRSTTESDWPALREFRVENAPEHPISYGATRETTLAMDEAAWRMRAARGDRDDAASFVAIEPATGRWVGMMSCLLGDEHGPEPVLTGVYVSAEFRGRDLEVADRLLDHVERWASTLAPRLRLFVYEGSTPALRLYSRRGFTVTGRTAVEEMVVNGLLVEMSRALRSSVT
jgi:ribosomal protein S18 acetylase RimI-like enzyme